MSNGNSSLEQRVAALEEVVNHLKRTQPHLMPEPAPEPAPEPVSEPQQQQGLVESYPSTYDQSDVGVIDSALGSVSEPPSE